MCLSFLAFSKIVKMTSIQYSGGVILKKAKKLILIFLIIIFISCIFALYLHIKLSNIVIDISDNAVKSRCAILISRAIYNEIDNSGVDYDSLISLEKDGEGNITALTTKIVPVNKLKSNLSLNILDNLAQIKTLDITVPIGNIIGVEVFSGFGPEVKVKIIPSGNVLIDFENKFESSGINQTRHQIIMKINANVLVLSSTKRKNVSLETSVCIAETVIVGKVPESFTNIDAHTTAGDNSKPIIDKEDLFNFVY